MSITFDNLQCYPMGNAQLSVVGDELQINNIGNTGLDGVLINVGGNSDLHIEDEHSDLTNGGMLRIATIGKNQLNQNVTLGEKLIWYDPNTQKLQYAYNMGLVPQNYSVFGNLNGSPVFDIPKSNPTCGSGSAPQSFWVALGAVAAAVTAAVAVYNAFKETHHVTVEYTIESDGSWKVVRTETTDPNPVTVTVDGQDYVVDEWGIKFQETIPQGFTNKVPNIIGVQLTAHNLSNFKITNLQI